MRTFVKAVGFSCLAAAMPLAAQVAPPGLSIVFNGVGPIPGNPATIQGNPALWFGNLAFVAGALDQQAVYLKHPASPCLPLVNSTTAIPDGTGDFSGFPPDPCISGGGVVFGGTGASGQQGLYQRFEPPDPCIVMADLNTAIPGGSFGNFTRFFPPDPFEPPDPCIRGDTVAFIASGPAVQGVYARHPPQPCIAIADTTTAVPNGNGSFATFWPSDPTFHPPDPCINGAAVAFWGADASGLQGLYVEFPPSPCLVLVNSSTPIPGGSGAFQTFTALAFQGTTFAFVGGRTDTGVTGAGGPLVQQGVYKATLVAPGPAAYPPAPVAVANLNTVAPGGLGAFVSFGAVALDPAAVVFEAATSTGAACSPTLAARSARSSPPATPWAARRSPA